MKGETIHKHKSHSGRTGTQSPTANTRKRREGKKKGEKK